MSVDMAYLSVIVGTLLPILVALVTKKVAEPAVKAITLAALSAATGLANGALQNGGFFSKESLISAGVAWVTAVASYYGLWTHTGVTAKVADVTGNHGIG